MQMWPSGETEVGLSQVPEGGRAGQIGRVATVPVCAAINGEGVKGVQMRLVPWARMGSEHTGLTDGNGGH